MKIRISIFFFFDEIGISILRNSKSFFFFLKNEIVRVRME